MSTLVTALRGAVDRGELSAWFQPQVDLRSGRIVAAEALCRWTHPDFGNVPPNVFIPLAEESGLIDEIGEFMLEQGCLAAAEWANRDHRIEVSVNVSPAQLVTSTFTDRLAEQLVALDLPPQSLTVEITEALVIHNMPSVVQRLDELRSLGLGVALDDFGVGQASLAQLDRLHATELKIDRSLIADESEETAILLQGVVQKVHSAGLRVVAEGIETAAQLERVRSLNCDRAQGYLLAMPLPKPQISELLLTA